MQIRRVANALSVLIASITGINTPPQFVMAGFHHNIKTGLPG
jgi:hypothetical protein